MNDRLEEVTKERDEAIDSAAEVIKRRDDHSETAARLIVARVAHAEAVREAGLGGQEPSALEPPSN